MADKQKTGLQAFKIDTRSRTAFITVWMQPHNSLCGVWGGGVSAYGNICLYAGGCLYVCCFFLCIKEHLLSVLRALGGAPPCPICPFFLFSSFSFVSHRP